MTKREILQEEYEEALFSLLMDDLAISEGRKALQENERLRESLDYIVPKETQKKCEQIIARHVNRNKAYTVGKSVSRVISRVAVVAVIAVLLFTTAFAVSPTFRANALNLVIETFYNRTDFQFTEEPAEEGEEAPIQVNWIPDGYSLASQKSDSVTSRLTYCSSDGGEIKIFKIRGAGSVLSLDTEEAIVQPLTIPKYSAMLILKDDVIQIAWADEEREFFVQIYGTNISEEELIKVAENVIIK